MKNYLYILTITKNDKVGLEKTIASVDKIKTNLKIIHIIKKFSNNLENVETLKKDNIKRIIINNYDSGIYNSMNMILTIVPINSYAIFLNSGDTINGTINLKSLDNGDEFFLLKTYKKKYLKENIIEIKRNFLDGMPFCHQSLIFKKKSEMIFSEQYKICGDYDFILKWVSKKYQSPNKIGKINKAYTVFDINGISSNKRFKRDIEGFIVILRNFGFLKSFIYLKNRIKQYLKIIIF